MIYDVDNLVKGLGSVEATREALDWFKEETIKAGHPGLELQLTAWGERISNMSGVDGTHTLSTKEVVPALGFDSVTNYQFVHFCYMDKDYEKEILPIVYNEWARMDKDYTVPYYPHVSIGWDNNPRFISYVPTVCYNNPPEVFKQALIKAKEYVDSHNLPAPLITINRFGDNVIPSIGTPLPETQVTAEPDGELIVTGPQVALGYYGLQTETIRDGVLRTGDLGVIHEDGHITLRGRKKDFIVTAYGKNISITKLEERLKDIPGVREAVLIGENRPYCTALLWLEDGLTASELQIEDRIQEMNGNLSHPEQIRRYSVIHRPLSIQAGELTPNLKVKRGNVEEHLAEEIEEMYR
jgi:acyl-CoA synthetase (AMP-forming)/AMP-acid ligase II